LVGGGHCIDVHELLKFPLHAPHGDVQCSSGDDVGGGEMLPGARLGGDFHVIREIIEMFHVIGGPSMLGTVTDVLDSFQLCFWTFDVLFELTPLDEEFNGILQMDAFVSGMSMAFVEPTIFCLVDPFPLLRWSLWRLDADFC
jgi:hypothetical protein